MTPQKKNKPEPFEVVQIGKALLLHGNNRDYNSAYEEILRRRFGVEQDYAIITDPPYGIPIMTDMSFERKTGTAQDKWFKEVHENDNEFDPTPWLKGKFQLFWGANHYAHNLPHNGRWLVWDKRCQVAPQRNQADSELAWCSEYGAARTFYHVWDGFLKDSEQGNERLHPTQKPIALMEWCLEFTDCNTVFDPYMGSGTTGVAAVRNGRQFIGIEFEREYFEIACKRLAEAQSEKMPAHLNKTDQVDLFI